MEKPGPSRKPYKLGEAQRRIAALLAEYPDAHERFTLVDIARIVGCTKQNVAYRLPGYTTKRRSLLALRYRRKLETYLKQHPGATRGDVVAATLDIPKPVLAKLWKDLGLPSMREPTSPERRAQRRAELQRAKHQRILRKELCVICGNEFGWTGQKEKRRRLFDAPITCSRSCSIRYFRDLRG